MLSRTNWVARQGGFPMEEMIRGTGSLCGQHRAEPFMVRLSLLVETYRK